MSTRVDGAEPAVILITAKATLAAGAACLMLTVIEESGEPVALQPVREKEQPPGLRQDHRARPPGRPAPGRRDLRGRVPARQHRARPARRIRPGRAMTAASPTSPATCRTRLPVQNAPSAG